MIGADGEEMIPGLGGKFWTDYAQAVDDPDLLYFTNLNGVGSMGSMPSTTWL